MKQDYTLTRRRLLAAGTTAIVGLLPTIVLAQQSTELTGQELSEMKPRFTFAATLYDNPTARDFRSLMPLNLSIEDYSNNEKIAYLPRKLSEVGSRPFSNEQPGDLCYYAPWGNLVMYYAGYKYSRGLIRLGRFDDGVEPLLTRGKFPLHVNLSF